MIQPFISHGLSFLIGAIPVGFLLARLRGIDIRGQGSGNIGATNVARTIGKKAGIITLFCDVFKGGIGAALLPSLLYSEPSIATLATHGLAAALGHCFSPFLSFRGGKGVATSLGVLLALSPIAVLGVLTVFGIVFWRSRYVSLASIASALSCPPFFWLATRGTHNTTAMLVTTALSLLIVVRHKANISRLLRGEEKKFSSSK